MRRHEFLKRCVAFTAGVACLDLGLSGCAPLPYAGYLTEGSALIVNKADFGENEFVLLKVDALPAPIFVAKHTENEYTAILLKCTHRGCQVQPAGEILECPCHGSRYTHAGKVIRGPAPENLTHFTVEDNKPVMFQHPLWSLRSGLTMYLLWISRRLAPELKRAGVS